MRILWLTFLHTAVTSIQGYGGAWQDLSSPEAPSFQRPVDVMTDIINDLGVRILQQYGENGVSGNVAFSPTGIGFVLAALYEGSLGPGNEQIAHVLGLPRDIDVTRIGLRDIHRRLRSYLSPDGFLGGLTLNRENTKLRPEYEDVLKFLGFDLPSVEPGTNATQSSTLSPEAVTTREDVSTSGSPLPCSTETTESPVTSTIPSKVTITSKFGESDTTTSAIPEEVTETSTNSAEETTTPRVTSELPTTLGKDSETTTRNISEPETTAESSTLAILGVSTTTPHPTTIESETTLLEVTSSLTETSSATTELPSSTLQPMTTESLVVDTTLASVEEVSEATTSGTTESPTEDYVSGEITESMIPEVEESTLEATMESTEAELEMSSESSSLEESEEDLELTPTESTTTLEPEERSSNEIDYDSTTIDIETTTDDDISDVQTIANLANSENLTSKENEKIDVDTTTTSSSPEKRRIRKIGIRDPVVRTLLNSRSANTNTKVPVESDFVDSKEGQMVWINGVVEYSTTERNPEESTTSETISQIKDNEDGDSVQASSSIEAAEEGSGKIRGTRSPRSYFSSLPNFPNFPSFPVYPDFPGFPEESSWTRKVGGWRVHSPKIDETSRDSTELTFFVNGEDATLVSAATYTVVLPFAFLPSLQALALEFPLDDPRYNILLLLPTDRDGTRRLARDLGNVGLRELRKELQPAWVRAMIPSFMLKGFVTLTTFLQRLGIRDVFEPRNADLSPMTDDVGVYARDVQQSIGVNIRNYMKPDRTHSRNGLFERAGPVSFVAEHPFLFFIIDAETGVSLIAGRIQDPLNSRIL